MLIMKLHNTYNGYSWSQIKIEEVKPEFIRETC